MTPIALSCMVCSLVIIWGGLIASSVLLARQPERPDYPDELTAETGSG